MSERVDGSGDRFAREAGANRPIDGDHVPLDLIAAYADQELDHEKMHEVEGHLAACAVCRRELALQRAFRDRLREEAAAGAPFALRDRVFAAVRAAPAPAPTILTRPARSPRRSRALVDAVARRPGWAVAAVLAIALVASVWDRARLGRDATPRDLADAAVGASGDSAAIRGLIQGHAAAWNERDADAVTALLTADAVWVTSAGTELRGREAIRQAHAEWLAQDSVVGGTTHIHPPGSITLRFLSADVAVADLQGQFVASRVAAGQDSVVEQARIFVVATKEGGEWRIAQLRNLSRQGAGPTSR
jgi:uncharacterized protein (TIGR02246 family)